MTLNYRIKVLASFSEGGSFWDILKNKLEVPKCEDSDYENDQMKNIDLLPIPLEKRT